MTKEEKLKLTEIKRRDILDAAIEEFQLHGYATTSIDRIAERAKVSKRTVYNHFKNKEELFREILNCLLIVACAANSIVYEPKMPLEKQLKFFIKTQIDYFNRAETLKLARLVIVELIRSPALSQTAFNEFRDIENGLVKWLNQAKQAGQLSFSDTTYVTNQLMGMIKTVAFWPQILENASPLSAKENEKQATIIAKMFLQFYKA
jgi:TetR/AcrR family transcriptional regulator of autoinduction and epiphytic fitness